MHAIFCFLHREGEFGIDWECESLGFDFNNWYQELATINHRGEIEGHSPEDDWRGRNAFQEEYAKIPTEARWQKALSFSDSVFKCELANTLKLVRGFEYEIPEDASYDYFESEIKEALADKAGDLDPFYIQKAAVALSALRDRTGPFPYDFDNPYMSLRTFAYNGVKIEDENLAISFIDIHT